MWWSWWSHSSASTLRCLEFQKSRNQNSINSWDATSSSNFKTSACERAGACQETRSDQSAPSIRRLLLSAFLAVLAAAPLAGRSCPFVWVGMPCPVPRNCPSCPSNNLIALILPNSHIKCMQPITQNLQIYGRTTAESAGHYVAQLFSTISCDEFSPFQDLAPRN